MISDDIVRPVAFLSDFPHTPAALTRRRLNVKFSKNAFHCIFLMKYPYCAVFFTSQLTGIPHLSLHTQLHRPVSG